MGEKDSVIGMLQLQATLIGSAKQYHKWVEKIKLKYWRWRRGGPNGKRRSATIRSFKAILVLVSFPTVSLLKVFDMQMEIGTGCWNIKAKGDPTMGNKEAPPKLT